MPLTAEQILLLNDAYNDGKNDLDGLREATFEMASDYLLKRFLNEMKAQDISSPDTPCETTDDETPTASGPKMGAQETLSKEIPEVEEPALVDEAAQPEPEAEEPARESCPEINGHDLVTNSVAKNAPVVQDQDRAPKPTGSWTPERVKLLRELWLGGLSASQCANELGYVTRNAVIGKVHRLGLTGRGRSRSPIKRIRRSHQSTPRRQPLLRINGIKKELANPTTLIDIPVPIPKKLPMEALTKDTCKWPIGDPTQCDFHFCGHNPLEGSPFCEYHTLLGHDREAWSRISGPRRRFFGVRNRLMIVAHIRRQPVS